MDEIMTLLSLILSVLQICNGALAAEQVSEGSLRLFGGPSDAIGKVQIYHSGKWGTVCHDRWDISDGTVVCRQLGFLGVYEVYTDSKFGVGNWTTWLDEVECLGTEQMLADCPRNPWGLHNCRPYEDAGVRCMVTNHTTEGSIRLADGLSASEGRVEVYNFGEWGTVCDDGWDISDAAVVCRQLGFPGAELAFTESLFGGGTGTIWLREVHCSGAEQMLSECSHDPWDFGNSICDHQEDSGVRCLIDAEPAEGALRLMNGSHSGEGRLEVYHNAEWGSVCDNQWGLPDTKVACRQMGYKGADGFSLGAEFGKGSGQVWLDKVACKGNENRLDECSHGGWAATECTHEKDVGVTCSYTEEGDQRLVDGSGDAYGRVEIYYQGLWGTVCKNGWGKDEANVVCMGLGFDEASKTSVSGVPGGTGMILLENVNCIGLERTLKYCDSNGWGVHNCTHDDDVAIKCRNKGPLSWSQITGIVLGCVSVLLAICKCCLICLKNSGGNGTANVETAQGVEEPASEPLHPDSSEMEKPPPSYNEIDSFPKSQGNTSV